MKRILPVVQVGLGILALVLLVVVLNSLFQSRKAETAAERTPTGIAANATRRPTREGKPTPKPTKKPKVDWADATLEQVKFGKTRTLFSQNAQIKIWSWLPDDQRLLVELEDPESEDVTTRFRIVTLNIKTGEIVEYGRRRGMDTAPLWDNSMQSVVFSWEQFKGESPQVRLGHAGGSVESLTEGSALYSVQPTSGEVYFRISGAQPGQLRFLNPSEHQLTPKAANPSLIFPSGAPLIDPNGKYLAIVGSPTWGILDLARSDLREYPIVNVNQESGEWGTTNEAWSPNGKDIALVEIQYTNIGALGQVRYLALLNRETGQVKQIKLPVNFIMELDWSPKGKFLLTRGSNPKTGGLYPNTFWLTDSQSDQSIQLDYFPSINDSSRTFMAWNSKGQLAWIKNVPEGLAVAITRTALRR